MNAPTYIPRLQVSVRWEDDGWAQQNVAHVFNFSGVERIIYKHGSMMGNIPGTHGGYTVGRTWYTVPGADGEFDSFDDAVKAAFPVSIGKDSEAI